MNLHNSANTIAQSLFHEDCKRESCTEKPRLVIVVTPLRTQAFMVVVQFASRGVKAEM